LNFINKIMKKNGGSDVGTSGARVFWKTDEHVPFHDMRAIELAMKIAEDFKPHIIPAGSDGMDHYSISKYDKDPVRVKEYTLQSEIDMWHTIERGWNSVARGAHRPYIEGNHEDRRRRYLWSHPELFGLRALSPTNLYELDKLGIVHYKEDEFLVGDTLFHHGTRVSKYSAYTAKNELFELAHAVNSVTGHTHRGGWYLQKTLKGVVNSLEGFCLCDLNPSYVKRPNWQQGVIPVTVYDHGAVFEPVPFIHKNDRIFAYWRGKEYTN
jgi:hypothetical protein